MMQRHLRKIRKDNISNNNYFGYTSFAILEVVLIVVGIFLAIQLDNANNKSKAKIDVEVLLKEIMKNLSVDIQQSNRIFDRYISHNKISNIIFDDSTTTEDIIPISANISSLLGYYINFDVHKKGFEGLKKVYEDLPEKYISIYDKLDRFYDRSIIIDVYNKRYQKTIYDNFDYLVNNYDWYNIDYYNSTIGPEQIEYFTSSKCKSQTHLVLNDIANEYFMASIYRKEAIDLYQEIHALLGEKSAIPEDVNYNIKDLKKINQLIGRYHLVNNPDKELVISIDNHQLSFTINKKDSLQLFVFNDSTFFRYKSIDVFEFKNTNELLILKEGIIKNERYIKF